MNPNNLNGLTLQRLSSLITQSPDGFSAENGAIQYLGRQIHLHDGITVLTEHTGNTPESKQLLERLISLQPDIATQIARSKAQAIKIAASNLWDNCQYWAIEMSPTKEVQCAVFLESMRIGPTTMAEKLAETNSLTWAEKLEIMLAGDAKYGQTLSAKYWRSAWIPLSIRFEKAKNLFQHFSDTPAEEVSEINENMT
ncbi:hypothetical protein [Endozoicomonas sp. ONNA2]|uniref:hypothetical protein n=1 Tax=Endozoicomonas sp. ONNA2 TaxID=2828741 RepID=UPI0021474F1C|nr:hypothetical protein [Endozoicomonas sp. ONNA2]